jgi:hypothetical protein
MKLDLVLCLATAAYAALIPGVVEKIKPAGRLLKSSFDRRLEAMKPAKRLDYLTDYLNNFRARLDKWEFSVVALDKMDRNGLKHWDHEKGVNRDCHMWKMWELKFRQEHKTKDSPTIREVLAFARGKLYSEREIYESRLELLETVRLSTAMQQRRRVGTVAALGAAAAGVVAVSAGSNNQADLGDNQESKGK